MMTTRFLRTVPNCPTSSSSAIQLRCTTRLGNDDIAKKIGFRGATLVLNVKSSTTRSASAITIERERPKEDWGTLVHLGSLLSSTVGNVLLKVLISRPVVKPNTESKTWRLLHLQMLIERVMIDSRFFTLMAVAGSLLGSTLCFVEGLFRIVEAYFVYFKILSYTHQGHMMQLLIEAIDMFLVGTAAFIFGVGMYVMFVGSSTQHHQWLPQSNLFGLFYLEKVPSWAGMKSVSEAKSKIGHAVLMILQVGMLEKFNTIPLATSLDLACFAGALLISSASIFLLSKLSLSY